MGLAVEGALRLTQQIREAEVKREEAKANRKRQLKVLLEAEERLESAERLESLLRNRRSLLIRQGLESLKVEPDNPSEVPPPDPAITRDLATDPSLFEGLPS